MLRSRRYTSDDIRLSVGTWMSAIHFWRATGMCAATSRATIEIYLVYWNSYAVEKGEEFIIVES